MSTTNPTTQTNGNDNEARSENKDSLNISDSDAIFSEINGFVDDILTHATEDETVETVLNFLTAANGVALSRYSINNQIIIFRQLQAREVSYADSARYFAGYNGWIDEHNRHVKQGEEGYKIIAPVTAPKCPECGNAPNYHTNDFVDCDRAGSHPSEWDFDPYEEWDEGVIYFRTATTFEYNQTQPLEDADEEEVFKPIEEQEMETTTEQEQNASELINQLVESVEANGFDPLPENTTVEISSNPRTVNEMIAGGVSRGGSIFVTDTDSSVKTLKTLVHEVAHEILHHQDDIPREVEEIEAETIAYVVCRHFGFGVDNSGLYLAAWAEHARTNATTEGDGDTNEQVTPQDIIKSRLDTIQKTAGVIINEIE